MIFDSLNQIGQIEKKRCMSNAIVMKNINASRFAIPQLTCILILLMLLLFLNIKTQVLNFLLILSCTWLDNSNVANNEDCGCHFILLIGPNEVYLYPVPSHPVIALEGDHYPQCQKLIWQQRQWSRQDDSSL